MDSKQVADLVDQEILRTNDLKVRRLIQRLRVTPYPVDRAWDYGRANESYVCWTVLEHRESNTGIAFCEGGFGPSFPWGLVFLTGPNMNIGMDSAWFETLEEVVHNFILGKENDDSQA